MPRTLGYRANELIKLWVRYKFIKLYSETRFGCICCLSMLSGRAPPDLVVSLGPQEAATVLFEHRGVWTTPVESYFKSQ